ncbi:proprotein convertase subtilisin/kexin type 5-like isoform X2 [Orbicella faveolata]|uniref:proprotein convertase subtilisin/kexin type 5-like isoform X2 n=1 Tax=Orbicella faveolata TaxID=48498 RepID=UPI0009E2D77E|nr:proprotein convertase subtilisin/kexin type 5-like isoform X2 [Orbicella faveolata]
MKKALLLIVLLIVVIAVSARLPRTPGKHGPKKPNGCQLQNCKICHSKPFSCDQCDHGFLREKVPLGYACRESCSPGLHSVQGTCVEKQDCPQNCKTCQNRLSCSVCEYGHVLYKGYLGLGMGRCIKKCPNGFKSKVNPMGGNKCVKSCTANCEKCQGRFCSVCEHGHALFKGLHQRGRSVCVKKCPTGYKAKVNPAGGNECVRHCTANCKLCQGGSCSVCEYGHTLYKGFHQRGRSVCVKVERKVKNEVIVAYLQQSK